MQAPLRLFLLRHGEVETRYHYTFGGRIDMDLSPLGCAQAGHLARFMAAQKLDALYASPMQRVQQTLAPLIAATALTPVIWPDLQEVDFGDWTGLNRDAVFARFNAQAANWLTLLEAGDMANAEPVATFRQRIAGCLEQIIAAHPGQGVAVVCHGGVIRMFLALLLKLPLSAMVFFDFDYASLSRIDLQPHKTRVKLLNFTPWQHAV